MAMFRSELEHCCCFVVVKAILEHCCCFVVVKAMFRSILEHCCIVLLFYYMKQNADDLF